MDASQQQTDIASFAPLEPVADGFRNYLRGPLFMAPEEAMVDRAQLLKLTGPEMTVLVGGMRVLGANAAESKHGVFTQKPQTLTNDFFVNLLDMGTEWRPGAVGGEYEGRDRKNPAGEMDGHPSGSGVRLALAAARLCGGLREFGRPGEVRAGLRGGVGQGDEP